jgi:hypothetical protein
MADVTDITYNRSNVFIIHFNMQCADVLETLLYLSEKCLVLLQLRSITK